VPAPVAPPTPATSAAALTQGADGGLVVKLADFGLSDLKVIDLSGTFCGSPLCTLTATPPTRAGPAHRPGPGHPVTVSAPSSACPPLLSLWSQTPPPS
jgi:hypothetical protein